MINKSIFFTMWISGATNNPWDVSSICARCLCSGIDFIYSFNVNEFLLDNLMLVFTYSLLIFQDNYNPYFDVLYTLNYFIEFNNLIYIIFLADYIDSFIALLPTINTNHPIFQVYTWKPGVYLTNASFYYAFLSNDAWTNESTSFLVPLVQHIGLNETLHTACLSVIQIYVFAFFLYSFIIIYLNVFTSDTKNTKVIDQEFITIQAGVLAEEELGSFEDKLFYYFFFFFISGWFICHTFYALITWSPAILIYLWLAPTIVYLLIYIPFNFLKNFGISFTCYLRGVESNASLFASFASDVIVVIALFFRFFIQGIRLLLILFVYVSLHDLWVVNDWSQASLFVNESFLDSLAAIELNLSSISFFFFIKIPGWIFYLLFEIGHTFFVLTAQSFAFVAMIFWLFFFLYTCFTSDGLEEYISSFRINFKKNNI